MQFDIRCGAQADERARMIGARHMLLSGLNRIFGNDVTRLCCQVGGHSVVVDYQ